MYQPPDPAKHQIRLLKILEKPDSQQRIGPEHNALSYEWHPAVEPECEPLTIRTVEGYTLNLEINLSSFLHHYAYPGSVFWIDAVCINQRDLQERAEQVSMMGQIYGGTRNLLIWLGPERDDSKLALCMLRKHGRFVGLLRALAECCGRKHIS